MERFKQAAIVVWNSPPIRLLRGLSYEVYIWWAETPWRSWIAHGLLTLAVSLLFAKIGQWMGNGMVGWLVGSNIAAVLYIIKEIGDIRKYIRQERWREMLPDGVGDAIAPVWAALSAWGMFLFS